MKIQEVNCLTGETIIRDLTDEEKNIQNQQIADREAKLFDREINKLRIKRNNLLLETDYLGLSDNSMSEEMTTYRQELRDITNGLTTVEQVEAVEFPTKPNEEE
tara:strand:+ start:479 stop:790 length:312 start_codon:yes stop_codon:yes gene_type:complete